MKRPFFTLILSVSSALVCAQTYLTPNQLGSGDLPGTYKNLIFSLADGNWVRQITLPGSGNVQDKASITIRSSAAWNAQVLQSNTDVPTPALSLAAGQSLTYRYTTQRKRWEIDVPTVWALNDGNPLSLPVTSDRVVRARMADGAFSRSLNLPPSAMDSALVLVRSTATWTSRIDPTNVMHASTMPLRTGDEYAFSFNAKLGKWLLVAGPETRLVASSLRDGQIPVTKTATTLVTLPEGSAAQVLRLPASAGDRDRIKVASSAQARSTIANANVQGFGTMTVGQGQSYEFMWNAAASTWVPLKTPRTQVLLKNVSSQVEPLLTPVTELVRMDGDNRELSVELPSAAGKTGDRVVIRSVSKGATVVVRTDASLGMLTSDRLTQGEEVTYLRLTEGWKRETQTIRVLLTYGQGVSAKLGAMAAQARQIESLRLTNEALENSGAQFRFQAVGLQEVPNLGATLGDAVNLGRKDPFIQTERQRVMADAVYYEGIETGCGLAWVNKSPSRYNMFSAGSIICGVTVMRHELGHNMGLSHGDGVSRTAMSGNAVPAFATPNRFNPVQGLPLGYGATVPDEVAIMDKNAPAVARFRSP